MSTLDFTNAHIDQLITHRVGNKMREEPMVVSQKTSVISSGTEELLLEYFFNGMKHEELFCFTHSVKLSMNEVYSVVTELFAGSIPFVEASQNLASLLYQQSLHPKIKEGELNIVLFSGLQWEGRTVEALGIFKSETNVPYLKMNKQSANYHIAHELGYELKGMDKGCVIINAQASHGYQIMIVDHANRFGEAQYWKDDFLQVKPLSNAYHQTNQFLSIAKSYVTKQITEEFEVSKTDQIDLLNRSVEYFKTNDSFVKEEFEEAVFQNKEVIESFRQFDAQQREERNLEVAASFEISPQAVKKQARVFKSVLKLDKNFHIYIHGNRELIEKGVEPDGRKYYKIYFSEEN
jgi:hypothetical protein